jgi:hypothetical protein
LPPGRAAQPSDAAAGCRLAGRLSRAMPLLAARPGAIAVHAPLLLVLPGPSVALVLIIVGVLVVLVAFPGFVSDFVDILGRP